MESEEYYRIGMYDKCACLLENVMKDINCSSDVFRTILENNMSVVQTLLTSRSRDKVTLECFMEEFSNQLFMMSFVQSHILAPMSTELIVACNALWLGWHKSGSLCNDAEAVHLCRIIAFQAIKKVLVTCDNPVVDGSAESDEVLLHLVMTSHSHLPRLAHKTALYLCELQALLIMILAEHTQTNDKLLRQLASFASGVARLDSDTLQTLIVLDPRQPDQASESSVTMFRFGWGPVNATNKEFVMDLAPLLFEFAATLCLARLGDWNRAADVLSSACVRDSSLNFFKPMRNYIEALCQFNAENLSACQRSLKQIFSYPAGTLVEFRVRILQGRFLLKKGSAEAAIQLQYARNEHNSEPVLQSWEQKFLLFFHPWPEVTVAGVMYELASSFARDQQVEEASKLFKSMMKLLWSGEPLHGTVCAADVSERVACWNAAAAVLWAGDLAAGRQLCEHLQDSLQREEGKVLAGVPEDMLAHVMLADVEEAEGNYDQQHTMLDRSLKLLGQASSEQKIHKEMEKTVNGLAAKMWLSKARNCLRINHLKDMEHAINMAQISNPEDRDVLFYQCVLLLSHGDSSGLDLWMQRKSRCLPHPRRDCDLVFQFTLRDRVSVQQQEWLVSTAGMNSHSQFGLSNYDKSQYLSKLLE